MYDTSYVRNEQDPRSSALYSLDMNQARALALYS